MGFIKCNFPLRRGEGVLIYPQVIGKLSKQ
jgi:hypothetical protein